MYSGVILPATLLLFLTFYTSTLKKAATRRLNLNSPRERFFLLFVIYAFFGMKSILDRSYAPQILAAAVPLLLILIIDVLRLAHWQRYRPRVCIGMLLVGLAALAVVGRFYPDRLPMYGRPLSSRLPLLQNCLRPTSTAQEMLNPTTDVDAGPVLDGVMHVKALLDAHGIGDRQLLVYHSASQYYPLLNRHLPTKYYQLGWAADAAMEDELVGELKRNQVRAFLQVNEFAGCLRSYDVPDSYRIPRVDHYIQEVGAGGA